MVNRIILLLFIALPVRAQMVGPLLKCEWHQEEPYNNFCPMIDGQRTLVGCVATAMTQVMYTYRYPVATLDTLHGWSTEKYSLDDILPDTRIDWGAILPDYRGQYSQRQSDAIASLSLMAGMACRMNWGVNASGANTERYLETLPAVFGYEYTHFYDRAYCSPSTWKEIMLHELRQGHPLLYTAYSQQFNGHAFVIDGYDYSTGLYHVDWGFGGVCNGWFDIDHLNPFEHIEEHTPWGKRAGLFCNHTLLAVSPEPCTPFKADSLVIDVTLDSIQTHSLCLGSRSLAVMHFTNNTQDTLTYTYEILSNEPTDTALFEQADYIGLSCVTLLPQAQAVDTVLLRIGKAGERVLHVSPDDVQLSQPFSITVPSIKGTMSVGEIEMLELASDHITVTADIEGTGLVTWCLFDDPAMIDDTDKRHYSVGRDTITFAHLQPGHTYTLLLREPWTVRQKLVFTTEADAIANVHGVGNGAYYDLQGRKYARKPNDKIHIRNGRKFAR